MGYVVMKKFLLLSLLILNACSTEYVLMDESTNPVLEGEYTYQMQNNHSSEMQSSNMQTFVSSQRDITANDVFVVGEGDDFVTYQYKNVRVDEISPLASLYCADVAFGGSPYLREVTLYHNGFMRATFDCVSLAI